MTDKPLTKKDVLKLVANEVAPLRHGLSVQSKQITKLRREVSNLHTEIARLNRKL